MGSLRRHAGFLILLLVAAPLIALFAGHDGIATVSDDSVSYLTLARHFSGTTGPFLEPWVRNHGHFPPFFPLVLAATGGATDLLTAHRVVALFAIAAVAMVYAYGMLQFKRPAQALLLAVTFLLMPTAWISIKGILSESMFLFLSLAAICYYEWRLARAPRAGIAEWVLFGLLLAMVYLTRAVGLLLILAYGLHAMLRMVREPSTNRWRLCLPPLIAAAAIGLWIAIRPAPDTDLYQKTIGDMLRAWGDDPVTLFRLGSQLLATGWIASFTADADVSLAPKVVFAVVALLGLAGAVRRALANRLDGWYALLSVATVFAWIFGEENMRRLLYPLVPLLLAHAAETLIVIADRLKGLRHRTLILAATALVPALFCLPAALLVMQKSRDRAPFDSEGRYSAADITDYYTTISTGRARAVAARHAAVLYGLERIRRATPLDARVMWMRPEYVAVLSERQAVPYFHDWDARALARAIRSSQASHVVVATLFKTDLRHQTGDPLRMLSAVAEFSRLEYSVSNAVTGQVEFVLMKVDEAGLDALLAR